MTYREPEPSAAEAVAELARVITSHTRESISRAEQLAREALDGGVAPDRIVDEGLVAGMADVGRRFRDNEIFVPEVLVSAKAMHAALEVLEPALVACGHEPVGCCLLGTVHGDIHDIGKNLVGMMLRGAGFRIVDLGVNASMAAFNAAIEEHRPDIVGMSALLTTTMSQMAKNIAAWDDLGWRGEFDVIVGGAPLSAQWAEEIGAQGYGADAASAVEVTLGLVEQRRQSR